MVETPARIGCMSATRGAIILAPGRLWHVLQGRSFSCAVAGPLFLGPRRLQPTEAGPVSDFFPWPVKPRPDTNLRLTAAHLP